MAMSEIAYCSVNNTRVNLFVPPNFNVPRNMLDG